nr:MAG TPA: hypothetical protein [Caudoviricetes sp.]
MELPIKHRWLHSFICPILSSQKPQERMKCLWQYQHTSRYKLALESI